MKTKTFNEKLVYIFDNLDLRVDDGQAYLYDDTEAIQSIIDLICKTVEEAKPDCSDVDSYNRSFIKVMANVYQDNLINIVRGK